MYRTQYQIHGWINSAISRCCITWFGIAGWGLFMLTDAFAHNGVVHNQEASSWALNMPRGVTPISNQLYDLHMLILWICVWIGAGVFGVMIYSIIRHRKAAGAQAAHFHHSLTAEIVWTLIPIIILVVMAIPATKTLIAMEDTSAPEITLKVTAYQWRWKYEYVDEGVTIISSLAPSSRRAIYQDEEPKPENYLLEVDNRVVLPVNRKVRLLLTSDDVIHAWWVPALGPKKDAIPGYINAIWVLIKEHGVYRGQCAELCGRDHAFMPIVIEAKSDAEYRQWLTEQKPQNISQHHRKLPSTTAFANTPPQPDRSPIAALNLASSS